MKQVVAWVVTVALVLSAASIAGVYDVARTLACINGAENEVAASASPTLASERLQDGCGTTPAASVVMDSPRITEC